MMDNNVIKSGYMVKRSQNRRLYTIPNYKKRWFVITKTHLVYYDLDNEAVSNIFLFAGIVALKKNSKQKQCFFLFFNIRTLI